MSLILIVLTSISLVGLLVIAVGYFIQTKNTRSFILNLVAIGMAFLFLYLLFYQPEVPVARGGNGNDIYFVIVLYFFMILGMLAHNLFTRFSRPKQQRREFDLGMFFAPVFASPIIFIPLLSALQNANIDLRDLTTAKFMVFLVAFENGFFWKEYFDNRRQLKKQEDVEAGNGN